MSGTASVPAFHHRFYQIPFAGTILEFRSGLTDSGFGLAGFAPFLLRATCCMRPHSDCSRADGLVASILH